MVAMHTPGNIVILASGQEHDKMRGSNEKYAKFVYSTRYTFNIEANDRHFDAASFDGMLGLSDDGVHFRMRETLEEALIAGDKLYSRWNPWTDVTVETWLIPANPWHIRIHRVKTPRSLMTSEGGFAIARADFARDRAEEEVGRAVWFGQTDISAIVDLSDHPRAGRAHLPIANTNLLWAKTNLPQLRGTLDAGETVLMTAAFALPLGRVADAALSAPPALPDLAALEQLFRNNGRRVAAFDLA
jgi:hypothetical protein